jgi:hypothetical protein
MVTFMMTVEAGAVAVEISVIVASRTLVKAVTG